eukprot:scaffold90078_cov35-Phaeocystis_antarctica.AAC.2
MISRLHRAVCQLLPQPRWRRESLVLHRRGLQGRGDGLGLLRRVRRVSVITAAVAVSAAAVAQPATAVATDSVAIAAASLAEPAAAKPPVAVATASVAVATAAEPA